MTLSLPALAQAADGERYDPYAKVRTGRHEYDMREVLRDRGRYVMPPVEQPDLSKLGQVQEVRAPRAPGKLPEGWVQLGEVVQRREIAEGLKQVDPAPLPAFEDIEGNQYPRKGTVFLNFNGGILKSGDDNSALNKSTLARHNEMYPVFNGTEATALSLIQAVAQDMETLGLRIMYEKRPHATVPYTMAMIGGSWTDTNIGDPAGGVAPGTDCEDRDQRNVVYAFDGSSATVSQEIAHAWGLDHTLGSDRIMSYQFGNNKHFGDNCQALCEEQCQGPGSIGCRLIHEMYCGEGSDQQNDLAELQKIFTKEIDTEPPTAKFVEPSEDVVMLPTGSDLNIKAEIHDNFGGVGWKLTVIKDGEVVVDEVDFDRFSGWFFSKLPDGEYVCVLEAEDHADHIVQDKLTIIVGKEGPMDPTTGTTGMDPPDPTDTSATEPMNTSSTGSGSGSGSTTGKGDDSSGCECSAADNQGLGALALPLLGLWWAHRGRRRRSR